ncbi:hypothetical protein K2173_022427 [Erythroxylum novogranatense]|uniref:Uncharacterized protein n=1 Tax=Erythroxylum novogranatense TaxID=1862640 RepID=A0AAV8TK94_9ROSI|nr:hypothetical protein K2173_022427 [Erythroxylum novogranatense]
MGQAFRRASGRIRATDPSPKTAVDRRPPVGSTDKVDISRTTTLYNENQTGVDSDGPPRVNPENILDERDPQYDAMLGQMLGRIRSKPGGKAEIGEASVVERYNRPMPKLRNTKTDSGRYEDRPVPPGTLNVTQLRHIILLHQGKAEDHEGPMSIHLIAEKFQLEVAQVERIVQSISLPPEDIQERKSHN